MTAETTRAGQAVWRWWRTSIDDVVAEGAGEGRHDPQHESRGAKRKNRAELKRAASPAEVLAHPATHRLYRLLCPDDSDGRISIRPERLALIASVLAGVEANRSGRLPARFGERVGDRPALSPLRFQRIIRAEDDWRLAVFLRRALPLVDSRCNVSSLGSDLFYWGKDLRAADDVRTRWCFDYYRQPPPDALDPKADVDDAETISEGA